MFVFSLSWLLSTTYITTRSTATVRTTRHHVIIITVERRSQHQIAICPGLEPEVYNLLAVQVIRDILKQHPRHLAPVFITGGVPQLRQVVERFHTHCQLNSGFLRFCRARLPVCDLAFVELLTLEEFLLRNVPFQEEKPRVLDAPFAFGNRRLFLRFEVVLFDLPMLRLYGHLYHQRQGIGFDGQQLEQPSEVVFNDVGEHRAPLATAPDPFRMAVAPLAVLVYPAEPGAQRRVIVFGSLLFAVGAVEQPYQRVGVRFLDQPRRPGRVTARSMHFRHPAEQFQRKDTPSGIVEHPDRVIQQPGIDIFGLAFRT